MFIVNILSNRIIHLFQSVQTPVDLTKLMIPVDLVNRIVEGLQIYELLFDLCETMSSLYRVYWTL